MYDIKMMMLTQAITSELLALFIISLIPLILIPLSLYQQVKNKKANKLEILGLSLSTIVAILNTAYVLYFYHCVTLGIASDNFGQIVTLHLNRYIFYMVLASSFLILGISLVSSLLNKKG